MPQQRDPVQRRAERSTDLQDVATWEPRSAFDRFVTTTYSALLSTARVTVVLFALFILIAQFVIGGLGAVVDPVIGTFTLLSVVPALLLAGYVWYADVTSAEPLGLLVGTFLLGVLFAGFAGLLNPLFQGALNALLIGQIPFIGTALFFYLVVGPVEEGVKLLAVRLYAYRRLSFDAVIDGAVYGAVAGLGFATIENAIYITQNTGMASQGMNLIAEGGAIASVRALAGPGHVIYSAFAGYYLGLAKFNQRHAGPIVLKGLIIAALIHGTYNTLVSFVPEVIAAVLGVGSFAGFILFVLVYDGIFGLWLVRKLARYRAAFEQAEDGEGPPATVGRTEFDAATAD
jgi:RsiW-degrading membrane proteinase PrsW (M82 family)